MSIRIKRIYQSSASTDGTRILVDRLWPRGVPKSVAEVDEWLKDIAPSQKLRKWFGHKPERWREFIKRYTRELRSESQRQVLQRLKALSRKHTVTLLFGTNDRERNNAVVLAQVLVASRKRVKKLRRSSGKNLPNTKG